MPLWWNGRHESFKSFCRKAWGFDTPSRHKKRKKKVMTQDEFNKQMDKAEWGTVKEAVRLCLEHPCYAQIWYENKYGNEKE